MQSPLLHPPPTLSGGTLQLQTASTDGRGRDAAPVAAADTTEGLAQAIGTIVSPAIDRSASDASAINASEQCVAADAITSEDTGGTNCAVGGDEAAVKASLASRLHACMMTLGVASIEVRDATVPRPSDPPNSDAPATLSPPSPPHSHPWAKPRAPSSTTTPVALRSPTLRPISRMRAME